MPVLTTADWVDLGTVTDSLFLEPRGFSDVLLVTVNTSTPDPDHTNFIRVRREQNPEPVVPAGRVWIRAGSTVPVEYTVFGSTPEITALIAAE